METIETGLDPSQSLQVISETISKTKENIRQHSFCFMLWGWLIAIANFSFYILHSFTDFRLYFLPFPILVVIGIIATIAYYTRSENASETYLGNYLKKLWIVLAISFILAVFITITHQQTPFSYTLLIGGIGTLASGLALRFRPLIIGGILFLLAFVLSAFVAEDYKPLIQGIAVITGYLVPGYLLKYSKA